MKKIIVTTSWDDGHKLDVRLAELLKKYDIKATFYISPRDHELNESDRLTDEQIKEISKSFEIGAHTMTHPRLHSVSDEVARKEISDSVKYLEKLTGQTVDSFCYPGGFYKPSTVSIIRDLGIKYARTVKRFSFNIRDDSLLEARTSVNTYNHYSDLLKIARFTKLNPFKTLEYFHWDKLAIAMFDKVMEEGGEFHLWGHSWEVDGHGDWEKLEKVLRYISHKKDVIYVTNGELEKVHNRKVLIVAPYYPPHIGGQEFYAYNIAKKLKKDYGWDVIIATSGSMGVSMKSSVSDGLKVYRLPYWIKLSNSPLNPMWFMYLRKIVKEEQIEIINAHAPVPGMADIASLISRKVPLVVTYHMLTMKKGGSSLDWIVSIYEKLFLPRTLGHASKIICASSAIRDDFLQDYSDKSSVVTPGVDIDFYTPTKEYKQNTLLYVGSVSKTDIHKGLRFLLEAFAMVSPERPEAKLLVVGAGRGREYFEEVSKQLGIAKNVTFTGGLYKEDLRNAFQNASMLVMPSLNESFGMVCVEAMACGIPVVATKVGVLPEIIESGKSGFIVPPSDPSSIAKKIIYLLDNTEVAQKFGVLSRQNAEKLSWTGSAEKTNDVLLSALHDYSKDIS